ncbi:hypothetical protein QF028_005949 [Neobacillus sp. B4I6]
MKVVHKKPGAFCGNVGYFLVNILAVLDNLRSRFAGRIVIHRYL